MDLAAEIDRLVARFGWASVRSAVGEPSGTFSSSTVFLEQPGDITIADPVDLPASGALTADPLPARYEDHGELGVGGVGVVRRVRDRELGRFCAIKVVRPERAADPATLARFAEEARVVAQLQHPGIPPIYEIGRLADGRPWFTMMEVRGITLKDLIRGKPWSLQRRLDVFAKACDAVGYAHARGVVHRDLKPANVMVGPHGETWVVDWGLAKVSGRAASATVAGTATYMSPEQARGEVDDLDARSDVYSLGAVLYEVLSGRQPYRGASAREVLDAVVAGPPRPLSERVTAAPELAALVAACMSRSPADRPADAAALAREVRAWLDGERRRETALGLVAEADAAVTEAARLEDAASALRARAATALSEVRPWEPEERKVAAWEADDEATRIDREVEIVAARREQRLEAALSCDPGLAEAHTRLIESWLAHHGRCEAEGDPAGVARAEAALERHAAELPEDHPVRRGAATYLRGDGALTLLTDPDGAEVELLAYQLHHRRLVATPVRSLGRTPLRAVSLPRGRYLCRIRHPERGEVRYPVAVGRGEHWDGVPPGASDPAPIWLPPRDEDPDSLYVPAGWFRAGGDPDGQSPAGRRLWCDGFRMSRFQVTQRQYLAFLDALVAAGREEEAERHAPRIYAEHKKSGVCGRDASGRYVLLPDADGDVWNLDWPAMQLDWFGAVAWTAWHAERTGRPWRLPAELEWEKAARGVDGRLYPWGDRFDGSWCCNGDAHPGERTPAVVDSFPVDESPYGVRGLAGNVQEWCLDPFGRWPDGERVEVPAPGDPSPRTLRVARGGAWPIDGRYARATARGRLEAAVRVTAVGFRAVCSVP